MANAMEEPWMDIDGDDMPDMLDGLEDILMMDFSGKQESSSGFKNQGLPTDNLEDTNLSEEILHKFFKDASTSFFNEFGIINHQINSFNDFITNGIHKLFDGLGEFHVDPAYNPSRKADDGWKRASIRFGKVTVESPTFCNEKGEIISLTPRQARLQNITYSSRVNVEVTVKVYTKRIMNSDKFKTGTGQYVTENVLSENKSDMLIGRIPIMVKSSLCCLHGTGKGDCPFDHGGYFLIKGMEKTFVAQEQRCLTRLWVSNSPNWMVTYYPPDESKRKRVYVKFAETPKVNGLSGGKVINLIFMYAPIPIWIMFFALGASSDKEIVEMIDLDISNGGLVNILLSAISDADQKCEGFRKSGKALEYLQGQLKSMKFPPEEPIEKCIEIYLFPTLNGHKQKALFLAYLVKCLLLSYFGQKNCDNRDDIRNKRLELAGGLLERELRVHIRHAGRRMIRAVQRDLSGESPPLPIECYFDASIITNGLLRAFSTGGWSHPYKRTERLSGVVATLRRANPLQMMADMRKTRLQIQYTGKVGDARFPNPSYWGRLCFLSTPDGENCGLVKNLAVTGLVSTSLPEPSLDTLISCGMETLDKISPSSLSGREKVFLNGNWVGSCEDPYLFVQNLRNLRRRKLIHPQVEIKRDQQQREVRIFSDAGRILRPLLIVENNRLCLSSEKIRRFERGGYSFASLLEERILELIGTEEEEDCRVAWVVRDLYKESKNQPFVQYTHCELDQSFLLGLSCGLIPFPNHNNARRVLYEAEKHSQQAIGFNTLNPNVRVDTLSHRLYYPQKPLFKTMLSDCLGKPEFFNGQNAIVAVNVHHGFNQEDSLVMNRASLERGMFRTEHFRSYKADVESREMEVRKGYKPKDRVDFGKPQSGYGRVDSLEDDGFPFIGASMNSGDIVIGRVGESGANHGVKLKHTEKGMVQKVVVSSNDDGKNFAVVTLKQVRSPCLGDKFSSMHGQKGVVGLLESQENFPFTREGIVPDMVINPHAFPTRQTPGQLLETALGKGITCGGLVRYATPFTTPTAEVIMDQLHRHGFARCGRERVYDGRLGKSLRSMIFMGPTFYQRLVHMAEDKVKFRNTGPVHPLTRQPVADRKRYGGVKFGEMERDCMLAHGAAANLYERLFVLSDFSQMFICQKCCHVANVIQRLMSDGRKIRGPYCQFCKSADNIVRINVPYGAKLLYQELFSVGICLKFDTELC